MERNFFEHIKRLQALAEIGLEYSNSSYDIERYEEIQEICLEMLGQLTDVPLTKIKAIIQENNGYKTPKVDVRAVVFIRIIMDQFDILW